MNLSTLVADLSSTDIRVYSLTGQTVTLCELPVKLPQPKISAVCDLQLVAYAIARQFNIACAQQPAPMGRAHRFVKKRGFETKSQCSATCSLGPRFFLPTRALPFRSLLPAHSIARKWAANSARSLHEDLNLKAADLQNRSALLAMPHSLSFG